MEKIVDDIILKYYGNKPEEIKPLGGGFYGRVFFAKINTPPHNVIVKIYLYPKLAMKEAAQLEILGRYSLVKMPIVYHVFECDNFIQNDILLMEYIPGIKKGFGEINSIHYEPNWNNYYKKRLKK